jgi:ribosomal protein S4
VAKKKRLDVVLTERGLAPSRARAQALILAGKVRLRGEVESKAGTQVEPDAPIEISEPPAVSPTSCSNVVRDRSSPLTWVAVSSIGVFATIPGWW